MVNWVSVLFVGIFIISAVALSDFLIKIRNLVAIWRAGETDIEALSSGIHGVAGTADVHRETVTAPLSGQECLGYEVEIQNQRVQNESSDTVHKVTEAVPFIVRDGTGELLVDPGDEPHGLRFEDTIEEEVEATESLPPQFESYLNELDDVDHEAYDSGDGFLARFDASTHVFWERRLDVGEETYVLGAVRVDHEVPAEFSITGNAAEGQLAAIRQRLTSPFIVGDRHSNDVARSLAIDAGVVGFVALLALIVSVAFLFKYGV